MVPYEIFPNFLILFQFRCDKVIAAEALVNLSAFKLTNLILFQISKVPVSNLWSNRRNIERKDDTEGS